MRAEACLAASAVARACCLSRSLAARFALKGADGVVGDDGLERKEYMAESCCHCDRVAARR